MFRQRHADGGIVRTTSGAKALSFAIRGSGSYLPGPPVFSNEIDHRAQVAEGTTERLLNIRYRHFAQNTTSSEMAAAAAREALEQASWAAEDLDLIVSACAVMEQPIPTQAVLVQRHLGLAGRGTPVLDINTTCLSFLSALDTVSYMLAAGRYRRVLIVSSEMPSRALDWSVLEVCGNFGDGAAAVVLERIATDGSGTEPGILAAHWETWSDGAYLCEVRTGGTLIDTQGDPEKVRASALFRMEGTSLYRTAARRFPAFLNTLLDKAGRALSDIDVVIPHQASAGAMDHLRHLVGVDRDRVVDIFQDHGNQVAASLPVALNHAFRQGRLAPGQTVLLVGTAAGVTLGGLVLKL